MEITLTALHWIYMIGVIFVIAAMAMRKDVVVPCLVFTVLSGLVASGGNMAEALLTEARALLFSFSEFQSLILGIGIMVMMSKQMADMGTDRTLIEPVAKIVKNPSVSFFVLGIVMAIITALVWPSPGIALVGALLTPIALRAGMPAIWAAAAMNMFGHGFMMSFDPVIQGAVGITAGSAGIPIEQLMAKWPIWLVCGVFAIGASFIAFRMDMKKNKSLHEAETARRIAAAAEHTEIHPGAKFMAFFTVAAFVFAIYLILSQGLRGGDALNALIGCGAIVTCVGAVIQYGVNALSKFVDYAREGLQFGMMAFTPVLFIGGFFFIGGSGINNILVGEYTQGVLMDWAWWISNRVPLSPIPIVILLMIIGGITGLDGSGFSGLPLCGSLALAFGTALDMDIAVLAMIGQLGAVWIGGGTVVPWSVIPVAAMCNVDAVELCRKNMIPTFIGLGAACVAGILYLI